MSSSRKYSQYNTTYSNFISTPNRDSKNIFQSSSKYVLTQPSSCKCPLFKNYVEHNKMIAAKKSRNNHSISRIENKVRPNVNNMETRETLDTRHLLLSKKRREIIKSAETIVDSLLGNITPIHHIGLKVAEDKNVRTVSELNNLQRMKDIDPKKYIVESYTNEPEKENEFKSYHIQVDSLGSSHNRLNFLQGVNSFLLNQKQYKSLSAEETKRVQGLKEERKIYHQLEMNKKPKKEFNFSMESKRAQKQYKDYYFSHYVLNIASPMKKQYLPTIDETIEKNINMATNTYNHINNVSEDFIRKKQKINQMKF